MEMHEETEASKWHFLYNSIKHLDSVACIRVNLFEFRLV